MAEESRTVEKIYCHGNNNNDIWPAMAMAGGGFGASQWTNNPFAYMMMMAMTRMFGWNDGNGQNAQNAQNIELQNQIQSLRTQLQDNQNAGLVMDAVKNNDFAISQLAQNLGIGFASMKECCCQVQRMISEVAGQVGFSAERVINAANMGDCRIIEALKDCCCQNKELVQRMGYENMLAQKDSLAAMTKGFCDLGFGMQSGFDRTNTGVERGFAQAGFQAQQDKCDILRAGEMNTQRIVDTLNNHWKDEQAREIQDLKFQLSQKEQNEKFAAMLYGRNCGCGCGNNGGF